MGETAFDLSIIPSLTDERQLRQWRINLERALGGHFSIRARTGGEFASVQRLFNIPMPVFSAIFCRSNIVCRVVDSSDPNIAVGDGMAILLRWGYTKNQGVVFSPADGESIGFDFLNPISTVEDDLTPNDEYECLVQHTASSQNRPTSGGIWGLYWQFKAVNPSAPTWVSGTRYSGFVSTDPQRFDFFSQEPTNVGSIVGGALAFGAPQYLGTVTVEDTAESNDTLGVTVFSIPDIVVDWHVDLRIFRLGVSA